MVGLRDEFCFHHADHARSLRGAHVVVSMTRQESLIGICFLDAPRLFNGLDLFCQTCHHLMNLFS